MNIHHACELGTAFQKMLGEENRAAEGSLSSSFLILPMSWLVGQGCQTPAGAQNALFLVAYQQATAIVMAARRRRQMLFARGVHLWN